MHTLGVWVAALFRTAGPWVVAGVVASAAATGCSSSASWAPGGVQSARSARDPVSRVAPRRPQDPAPPTLVGRGTGTRFQPAACIGRGRGVPVFLDPGHGGLDPGAVGQTATGRALSEAPLTLAIALATRRLLLAHGIRVVLARTAGSTVVRPGRGDVRGGLLTAEGADDELAARIACANAARARVLVGIHLNAFSDPTAQGAETLYCAQRRFSPASLRLAGLIQRSVVASLARAGWRVPDRGVKDDRHAGSRALDRWSARYGHLLELGPAWPPRFRHPSRMPGVIVEPLFITNPTEAVMAASPRWQAAIAAGIAGAVRRFLASRPAGG